MLDSLMTLISALNAAPNVTSLTLRELETKSESFGRPTETGGLCFYSNVRNRSAGVTVVIGGEDVQSRSLTPKQKDISANIKTTLDKVSGYLKIAPLISIKRAIGANDTFNPRCNLLLSTQRADNVRQAYLWAKTLRDVDDVSPGPDLHQIVIPEWPDNDRQILMFPEHGVNLILGSDYVGEVKMGFLRMAMWKAKQQDMLSLHAGSKVLSATQSDGQIKRYGMLLFGLSGTGKSTHACHVHGLDQPGEGIEILQDDIVFLKKDGGALGSEQGFYLKTEGVNLKTQPILFEALSTAGSLFENVMVDSGGHIDLTNLTLGGNGRAVVPRDSMGAYSGSDINMPPLAELDGLIIGFITRRMTVVPIASKLNAEQAAAAFMLGESVETSAGDPQRAGESIRVVGTNPFIIGDPGSEGRWFYDFLKNNEDKVHCYLLNTGGIGEIRETGSDGRRELKQEVSRFTIEEMSTLIRGIARGTIRWSEDTKVGSTVPEEVDGLDVAKFRLENYYSSEQIRLALSTLQGERVDWLQQFERLPDEVRYVFS